MQATCTPLDASQLLRDILQSKENYQAQFSDSTNSSTSIRHIYAADCNSEMISPLLHSKSSDMAFNDRDNDNDIDNDNDADIDVATDNNSCINDDDQSDDLDDRSLDASTQEDKSFDHEIGESKEEKRAHAENILTGIRNQPLHHTSDLSVNALTGDFKRQKRKQAQPQQHESNTLQPEELAIQRQIQQLQEQMQAVKRKRKEDLTDDDVLDGDLTDGDGSKPSSPVSGESKRARVENILNHIRSPSHLDNGYEFSNRVSPGSENGKKQKRKQTQPQQHDNGRSDHRDGRGSTKYHDDIHRMGSRNDADNAHNDEGMCDINNSNSIYGADNLLRNNLYHGVGNKTFLAPFQNGFDPHFYRENFFRHNMFGLPPSFDPVTIFRSKALQMRSDPGHAPEVPAKSPQADLSKIASVLKVELTHAVNKAIDNAVSKVFSDKLPGVQNVQSSPTNDSNTPLQQQQQNGQHQQQKNQPNQQHKLLHSPNLFHNFLHQQQIQQQFHQHHRHSQQLHQQQQQQQQQQQHQTPTSNQNSEREALKETLNNSHSEKKPELNVSLNDHLHLLEHLGSRLPQDKASAFGPLHKSESEFITPHIGPSIPFPHNFQYYINSQALPPMYQGEPEQTEALPLLVNATKKKRTKVTDTKLNSPRKPVLLQDNTTSSSVDHTDVPRHLTVPFPHFPLPVLQTSVAIPNPSLSHSDLLTLRLHDARFIRDSRLPSPQDQSRGSPRSFTESPHFITGMDIYDRDISGDMMDGSSPGSGLLTSTLTPMHLRKAKLMFFYTRYPSSSILKMYFPDVMFNKNNTAQLVKWFSNFREFFYIQMEKYARQALAEGCKHPDDLIITADSELFRHLNLHYNRNNQLEVPHNFLAAVQAALREFYKSIQSNKDAEPSWKKAIYKIIARMDETLPDFFKSPNWMEQLGDQ